MSDICYGHIIRMQRIIFDKVVVVECIPGMCGEDGCIGGNGCTMLQVTAWTRLRINSDQPNSCGKHDISRWIFENMPKFTQHSQIEFVKFPAFYDIFVISYQQ